MKNSLMVEGDRRCTRQKGNQLNFFFFLKSEEEK